MNPGGVLVIGLDGGAPAVLRSMAGQGLMPTYDRLVRGGRAGTLRSTVPWYTVPGWASLMTGVDPGTHGLLYWVATDPADYFEDRRQGRRFLTSADLAFPTFWDVAGVAGRRVAVLNMPLTYPAWPVNGTMVTGLLTPAGARSGVCHPPDLLDRFPGYRVDLSTSALADSPDAPPAGAVDLTAYLGELVDLTGGRARVGTALLEEPVDLGVVVFVGPDRVSHKAWPEQAAVGAGTAGGGAIEELVRAYYRALDRAVADLLTAAGPEATVLVVADHGFGPPAEASFRVNAWLRDAGYLRLRAPAIQRAVVNRRSLRRALRPLARRWRRRAGAEAQPAAVDWSRTAAYAVGYPHTRTFGLVVNRAGAKREGWVQEDRAREVLGRLREELLALRDDGGRPVVRRIHTREDLRARAPGFPDLIVETEEPFVPSGRGLLSGGPFGPTDERSGLHEREGVLVLAGPRVRGEGPVEADIVDVAPTVLGLLGIGAPAHVQGRARSDLVELPRPVPPPSTVPGPGGREADVSPQEAEEIEAHLRSLGYTE